MSDLLQAMQNYTENLTIEPPPPLHVLHEAADALATTTKGAVQGSIFTINPGGASLFRHTFYLRAPALNDFTDALFYVWHDENLYPAHYLRAGLDMKTDTLDCADEQELRETLTRLFQESGTRQIVRSLLLQINDLKSRGMP